MTTGLQNRSSTNWAMVAREADCIKNGCLVKKFLYNLHMITIIAITDGFKHFDTPVSTYMKRLEKFIRFKTIKPISHTNPEYIRVKETLLVLDVIKKISGTLFVCDERGKSYSTIAFTEIIENARNTSEDIIFLIGGSYGLDLEVLSGTPHKLIRISDFVMPHSLALLVILEQIYRAHEIIRWSGYHHE